MKRILTLFIIILLLLGGCGLHKDTPQIEDYLWTLSTLQGGGDGRILACAPDERLSAENAQEIELDCTAANGKLTLTDHTSGRSYSGNYRRTQSDRRSSIYEITLDGLEGLASVAMTRYPDGAQRPTFIIRLDSYALNFHAAQAYSAQ